MQGKRILIICVALIIMVGVVVAGAFLLGRDTEETTEGVTPTPTEYIDKNDHDHQHEWSLVEVVEPWFERRGFSRYVCGYCGQEYDTDFVDALEAESIYCIYIQGDTVVTHDTDVQSLRNGLHVFATCTNGMELEIDSYMLDGALEAKTSVITVYFMDFSTTFNVTVEME